MEYLLLLGQPLSMVKEYFERKEIKYIVVPTRDPRQSSDEMVEERVIRIEEKGQYIKVLVGYFREPLYNIG